MESLLGLGGFDFKVRSSAMEEYKCRVAAFHDAESEVLSELIVCAHF